MPNLIAVLSPAKRLDAENPAPLDTHTEPKFGAATKTLVKEARALKPSDLKSMMSISDDLAELNHQRFRDFAAKADLSNAKQAIFMFRGDVYQGLDADTLSPAQLDYAQAHIRILSGLYGLLKPLDLIQPYRLEMGTRFTTAKADDLYSFWGDRLTKALDASLEGGTLVNLASKEYFSAVDPKSLPNVVEPQFKEYRDGKARIISFFAKKARGQMARFMIEEGLDTADGLKDFNIDGYGFDKALSKGSTWVFTRADSREATTKAA